MDRSFRWLEALPLSSATTAAITDAFMAGWMARFGVPEHITSNRGPQFCSEVWAQLTRHLGYLHHFTTAHHPQANSMVERCHCQLKDALRACSAGGDWLSHLLWVLLGLRAAPKEYSEVFLRLRWLMAPPWSCPASYPVSLSHRWQCLKRTSAWRCHSSHLGVLLLLLLTSTSSCSSSRRQLLSTFAEAAPSRHSHQCTAGHL